MFARCWRARANSTLDLYSPARAHPGHLRLPFACWDKPGEPSSLMSKHIFPLKSPTLSLHIYLPSPYCPISLMPSPVSSPRTKQAAHIQGQEGLPARAHTPLSDSFQSPPEPEHLEFLLIWDLVSPNAGPTKGDQFMCTSRPATYIELRLKLGHLHGSEEQSSLGWEWDQWT